MTKDEKKKEKDDNKYLPSNCKESLQEENAFDRKKSKEKRNAKNENVKKRKKSKEKKKN